MSGGADARSQPSAESSEKTLFTRFLDKKSELKYKQAELVRIRAEVDILLKEMEALRREVGAATDGTPAGIQLFADTMDNWVTLRAQLLQKYPGIDGR